MIITGIEALVGCGINVWRALDSRGRFCSALPKPVKDLVQLIFDIEQFKRTLCMCCPTKRSALPLLVPHRFTSVFFTVLKRELHGPAIYACWRCLLQPDALLVVFLEGRVS
jgi:hypothetical protein